MRWLSLLDSLAWVYLGPGELGHPDAGQAQAWESEFLVEDKGLARPEEPCVKTWWGPGLAWSTSSQNPRGEDLKEKAFLRGLMFALCLQIL